MANRAETVAIKDTKLIFRNFAGREDKYNRKGARNFCISLNETEAQELKEVGWNVKSRPPREEGDDPFYYLKVNVQFATRGRPPRVVMVTSKNKTVLDEDLIDLLDVSEITSADVRFRPYEYEEGKYSAYLVTMFANVIEDELEDRYSDIPYQGQEPVSSNPRFEEEESF